MSVKGTIQTIESSGEFKAFKEKHARAFIAHIFFETPAQIGIFDPESEMIATFILTSPLQVVEGQEVLRIGILLPLDNERISLEVEEARKVFEQVHKEQFSREIVQKVFTILQQSEQGPVYNITALTASIKTLNVKVSATDGKVISSSCEKLVEHLNG